ncbi:Uncharacterised protein [uncultured archaeon]|nr:Uncharacterised protein [uncultured archaeon]
MVKKILYIIAAVFVGLCVLCAGYCIGRYTKQYTTDTAVTATVADAGTQVTGAANTAATAVEQNNTAATAVNNAANAVSDSLKLADDAGGGLSDTATAVDECLKLAAELTDGIRELQKNGGT